MTSIPTLDTERLVLRAFVRADAPIVQRLVSERVIADTTLNIPHPYPEGGAETWIDTHERQWQAREGVHFAVVRRGDHALLGAMGLRPAMHHAHAEIGYWIGSPYWGQGYATEAARAVVGFGFEGMGLRRIFAHYLARNPASGRVLAKLGFRHEGLLRRHYLKWSQPEDVIVCGLLADELEGL